jgi:D-alanyl-lipoteichoic acid acyltransferase DltB (MBOAT superfamily)
MLFNTFQFFAFLAILLPLYWAIPHRAQNVLLLAASYYFYACWDARFLTLLIVSTIFDFACGLAVDRIEAPRKRRLFVALSMALNLGMLGYFKYYNFFAESLQAALGRAGVEVSLAHLNVVLPIGISFYTFQSMSYVIDVYRREIKPTRNLVQFAAFVSFFPHLVAGPIMRPTTLLPQIERRRRFNLQQFYSGWYLIFWGLTKKVVVADNLALFANDLFGRWETIDGGLALLAIYAFAFQIYCDFSGYTDAARGIARLLGIELALNFNLPYFATSPKDFWTRWHISLSTWLRDYLYIPLGGNRRAAAPLVFKAIFALTAAAMLWFALGPLRGDPTAAGLSRGLIATAAVLAVAVVAPMRGEAAVARNLMLTMVIGGLWHGAAWTFVVWGAYQGLLLIGHRVLQPWLNRYQPTEPIEAACWTGLRIVATFHLVCLGWLFFRAESMAQVGGMLSAIAYRFALPAASTLVPIAVCIVPLLAYQLIQFVAKDLDVISRTPWYVRSVFYTLCFYAFVLGGEFGGSQFIYFQF